MSTRHLRRLQEQLNAGVAQQAPVEGDSDEEEHEDEEQQGKAAKPFNPFDLLSDDEKEEQPEDEEEEEAAPQPSKPQQPGSKAGGGGGGGGGGSAAAASTAASTGASKGKKKKSKGKKKGGAKGGKGSDSDGEEAPAAGVQGAKDQGSGSVDEIDQLVRELNLTTVGGLRDAAASSGSTGGKGRGTGGSGDSMLLAVDVRSLRGDDELRRIFGADVVQSVDRQELAEAANRRRQAMGLRGVPASRRRPLKRGVLVAPKDHWPPFDGGLSMEIVAPTKPSTAPSQYDQGQAVLYQTRDRTLVPATVVHVDRSMQPPQYGIRREGVDGVVYTEWERLRPADAAVKAPKDGRPMFRYVYSAAYKTNQMLFEQAQASHDPNAIAALLQHAPYHVDSLLAMHDLYRHMGENAYAEECLARALYCLEMGWHPSFNIATANCRMSIEEDENRGLFVALFRHIQALSRQGCHRTALEVCKLMLALEPEDPMGALMMVDYLALRAGKYDFLREFVAKFEENRSLALLPNYAFATALARLRQQQQERGSASSTAASSSTTGASGAGAGPGAGVETSGAGTPGAGAGVTAVAVPQPSALELAVQAVLLHPLVVPRLLAKLQDKGSAKESHWAVLMGRRLLTKASDGGSESLTHLTNVYVERSALLWKPPDALELLRQACVIAAELTEGRPAAAASEAALSGPAAAAAAAASVSGVPVSTKEDARAAAAAAEGVRFEDWECVRREAFPASESNDYRHLRLHDFSDDVASLPREELNAAMAAGGVPEVEDALADLQEQMLLAQQQQQQQQQQRQGAPALSEEELRNANPLMMLLRSLMPWVNAGQQPDYSADEPGPEDGAEPAH